MISFDEAIAVYDPFGNMSPLDEANAKSDHDGYVANPDFMRLVGLLAGQLMREAAEAASNETAISVTRAWFATAVHMGIDIGRLMERQTLEGMATPRLICEHVWDGPRIPVTSDGASTVATCSKCGASAVPELTGDPRKPCPMCNNEPMLPRCPTCGRDYLNHPTFTDPQRPATPGPDKKD